VSLTPYVHLDASLADAGAAAERPLSAEERHHLQRVLRLQPGAVIEVADGAGWQAPARITAAGVALRAAAVHTPASQPALVLAQALPKGRKLDEVLRQATELGVDEVRLLTTERAVPRLRGARAERAHARWSAVVRAASEQARRPWRPRVRGPLDLAHLARDDELLLVAHPEAPGLPTVVDVLAGATTLTLAIGPEGGFTDREVAEAVTGGALAVSLGGSVLRTEHAGSAGIAVLSAAVGRWG